MRYNYKASFELIIDVPEGATMDAVDNINDSIIDFLEENEAEVVNYSGTLEELP